MQDKDTLILTAILATQAPHSRALGKGWAVLLRGGGDILTLDLLAIPGAPTDYLGGNTYSEMKTYLATTGVLLPEAATLDFGRDGRAYAVAARVAPGDRAYDAGTMRWGVVQGPYPADQRRLLMEEDPWCRRVNALLWGGEPFSDPRFKAFEGDIYLYAPGGTCRRTHEPACLNHRQPLVTGRIRKPYYVPSLDRAVTGDAITFTEQ